MDENGRSLSSCSPGADEGQVCVLPPAANALALVWFLSGCYPPSIGILIIGKKCSNGTVDNAIVPQEEVISNEQSTQGELENSSFSGLAH